MLALSVPQPWAYLMTHHGRAIENMPIPSPSDALGARITLRATAGRDVRDASIYVLERHGIALPHPASLPSSAIVATGRLVAVLRESDDRWFRGPFGWYFSDVVLLPRPIPCSGRRVRRLWTVPQLLVEAIDRQLGTSSRTLERRAC